MAAKCVVPAIGGVLEGTPPTGWLKRWARNVGQRPATTERLKDVFRAGSIGTLSETAVIDAVRARRLRVSPEHVDAF